MEAMADSSSTPVSITNYELMNGENELVPFSVLPQIGRSPSLDSIYLQGKSEDGSKNLVEPVTAWKLELSGINGPESFVSLKKNGTWVRLSEPRKIYEGVVRSILIAIQVLHFLKWNSNPNSDEKSMWDHLREVFDKFDERPSVEDLIPHLSFIKEFSEKDEILADSPFLKGFLERYSTTGQDGNDDSFDNVCCICDNGGELLCCEGNCMRSFHANKEVGEESNCESLCFSKKQLDEITNFVCKNCELKQHQCFLCGKLGNSDKNNNPEVFQCGNTACGYFYHAKCISKELCKEDEIQALKCEKYISQNGKFICPCHKCSVCKEKEQKDDFALQFALCRRCPISYHRKCLPWDIAFEGEGRVTRAWDDLLPNRILIYCMKHKIDKDLGTPLRNHIKFSIEKESAKEKEKEKEKENEKEKEKGKEKGIKNEKENSSSKRIKENEDPDFSPRLRINKIRIFENKKMENRQNSSKGKEKSLSVNKYANKMKKREINNKERERRKQEREIRKLERENKMEEIEIKKEGKDNKIETENKTNKKEGKEKKTEENKKEGQENKMEERKNKRKFHEERESKAKKFCTGLIGAGTSEAQKTSADIQNTVPNNEPTKNEAKKICTGLQNTVQNQEPTEMCQLYNLTNVHVASTSGSVMDRYTPKLEDTNLDRPGPSFNLGIEGFWPVYCYDMSGSLRRDLPPYQGPRPGSTCGWISD